MHRVLGLCGSKDDTGIVSRINGVVREKVKKMFKLGSNWISTESEKPPGPSFLSHFLLSFSRQESLYDLCWCCVKRLWGYIETKQSTVVVFMWMWCGDKLRKLLKI